MDVRASHYQGYHGIGSPFVDVGALPPTQNTQQWDCPDWLSQTHHQSLSVVHVTLGWIISKNSVNHNLLLSLGEPSFFVPELLGLDRTRNHGEPSNNSDKQSADSLDQEQPRPTRLARNTTHVQESVCLEGRDKHGKFQTRVEETQTQR
ncbi:hypothetical protein OGAPHI_001978 [Ogataea philodendri]|uniref:Uncharacterized protein n=1 Tax=Ogataea philodendri TaxID=1378263 RepID=A0A9P8T790_9ASCO|nr:uncharacterized protein OGAPHI_001978 [Ogataea philodendri]KAH3668224.1 hypothetical protein OGAPHI_001978 [Ogataea philodendri]